MMNSSPTAMQSKIRVLDENTINKIAAGEVIENPSSVVKELVENAIDAGADEITVEIRGGGRQLIRVTDNGCGMSRDDALLCFERHATSKIRTIEELYQSGTMGFRGEAIPSIASISKLTLTTCPKESDQGTLIIVDGGKILQCSPATCSSGTTFEIKSLFHNVPVRKKFQRSPAYDANEILKVITVQTLAHPEIKFQLVNNQESVLSSLKCDLIERIRNVLGPEFSSGLCPVEREHAGYILKGFIGLPSHNRHNRTGQFLFINHRAVVSPLVSYAVRDGYGTSLPTNRHPVFVLSLTMEPSLVDVNVHPQKKEVRLRQGQQLREMIAFTVEEALQHTGCSFPPWEEEPAKEISYTYAPLSGLSATPPTEAEWKPLVRESASAYEAPPRETKQGPLPAEIITPHYDTRPPLKVAAVLPGYLLLTSEDGALTILNQRAAHARILYEKILDSEEKKENLPVQSLLVPYTLELAPTDAELLKSHLTDINKAGIQVQEFGANAFIIHSLPGHLSIGRAKDLILDILDELREIPLERSQEVKKRIAKASGRAAVSQHQKLTFFEAESLYRQLHKCRSPSICPFGKPTMVEMPQEEIAKQFQR